ncbi:MAG: ERAP1-like C-terminal domain-containing protein, partial [Dehalococcoidia bacterium]|nr:ERAP1-like C-terminal domain-containing protein [Dehalococcoidia bacterium]
PTLRPHQLEVALLRDEAGQITVDTIPAHIDGERTEVPEAAGRAKPDLVFPNWGDHAYAKVTLDPQSVEWVRANIERVEDQLLRQLLWSSIWNMVRDQQLKSTDFLGLVREKAPLEDIAVLDGILGQALTALTRFVPEERQDEEAHRFFEAALAALQRAPGGDAKIIWMRTLVASAMVPDDIAVLGRLAHGDETVEGLAVDQDMRWSIAAKYVAYDLRGAQERVRAEIERDPSDRGQRAKLRCEISMPQAAVKRAAWERFVGEGYGTLKLTEAAMSGFNWSKQRELLRPYARRFFEDAAEIARSRDPEYFSSFVTLLFPGYRVEAETLERSRGLITEIDDELPMLARKLREANDELERALRCREFAA